MGRLGQAKFMHEENVKILRPLGQVFASLHIQDISAKGRLVFWHFISLKFAFDG